jgi:hypothetical protein
MSEFLLVIPEGWIQLDWEYITNNIQGMSADNVNGVPVSVVEENLKLGGIIAPESSLVEFKLIDNTYFIIRLG